MLVSGIPSNSLVFVEHSPINHVPKELFINHIFNSLSVEDLGRVSCVCKDWRALASDPALWNALDLEQLFPTVTFFDEKIWKAHADFDKLKISLDDVPLLNKREDIKSIKNFLLSLPRKSGSKVTVLTIPKGLSLNKLRILSASSKQRSSFKFGYISHEVSRSYGNANMKKTCRVIITNDILKDTQGSLYSTQQELLSRMKCDTPELVPIIALVYLTSVNPSSYRGSTYPYAYGDTRCSEQLEGFPVIIGNHGTDGLTIIDDAEDLSAKIGIGAMRKLDN